MRRAIAYTAILLALILATAACRTSQAPDRQVNDMKITTEVKSKLASDVGLSTVTNIDVNTTNGVVTLSGQVSSEEIKHHAEQVARAVPNVVRVNNNLQVAASQLHPPETR